MKFEREIKILEKNKRVKNIGVNSSGILWFLFNDKPHHMVDTNGKLVVYDESNKPTNFAEFTKLNKLTESKSSVNKSELAELFTINNVKGKVFKESDINNKVLDTFNTKLKPFSSKYSDFDLFDDDYTGESSDEFIEMLNDAAKKSDGKISLLESGDMSSTINSLIGKSAKEARNIIIKLNESYNPASKLLKKRFTTKLHESVGSSFKTDTIMNKISYGIALTESDIEPLRKL